MIVKQLNHIQVNPLFLAATIQNSLCDTRTGCDLCNHESMFHCIISKLNKQVLSMKHHNTAYRILIMFYNRCFSGTGVLSDIERCAERSNFIDSGLVPSRNELECATAGTVAMTISSIPATQIQISRREQVFTTLSIL